MKGPDATDGRGTTDGKGGWPARAGPRAGDRTGTSRTCSIDRGGLQRRRRGRVMRDAPQLLEADSRCCWNRRRHGGGCNGRALAVATGALGRASGVGNCDPRQAELLERLARSNRGPSLWRGWTTARAQRHPDRRGWPATSCRRRNA
ncbi:hypothetical protein QJS66_22140 [Kocuria rhizophila]|nr:hypothetical protein QJS66_22140 [Kocuria rhizophila]